MGQNGVFSFDIAINMVGIVGWYLSSRDSETSIMKKSYIFISESDPIGSVILGRDNVPTEFQEKEITEI